MLSLDQDLTRPGLHLGLASVPAGFAVLFGTPIAAALVGQHGRWWAGSVFTGVSDKQSFKDNHILNDFVTRYLSLLPPLF